LICIEGGRKERRERDWTRPVHEGQESSKCAKEDRGDGALMLNLPHHRVAITQEGAPLCLGRLWVCA